MDTINTEVVFAQGHPATYCLSYTYLLMQVIKKPTRPSKKVSLGEFRFLVILLPSTFTLLYHSWNTDYCLLLPSHRFLINASDQLLRARHSWVVSLDPSLTISLSSHSFYSFTIVSLCLSPHLSLAPLSFAHHFFVFLAITIQSQNTVQLQSCNPVQVTSALQSIMRSVLPPFTLLKSDWHASRQFIHRNPYRNVKVCKHSQQLRTIYFVLWETLMLNRD